MQFGMFFELQLPRPWGDADEQALFQNALEADKLLGDQRDGGEEGFLTRYTLEDVIALVTELTREPSPTLDFFAPLPRSA